MELESKLSFNKDLAKEIREFIEACPLERDELINVKESEVKLCDICPVGKRILIKPIETQQIGKVIVTTMKPSKYRVIQTGDEVTKVSQGDTIFLEKHYGVEIEHEGEKFLVIDESSILAKIV